MYLHGLHTCTWHKDLLGGFHTTMEDIVKKTILLFIAGLVLFGCSSSDMRITDFSISDDSPVTGQKVLLQVYSLADKPPLTYTWTCSGGEFDENDDEDTQYYRYWVAPDVTGEQTVVCTVRDDDNNEESHTFTIQVTERVLEDDIVDGNVLSVCKQTSKVGGVWASTDDGKILFISSATNEETSWQGAFSAMDIELYSYYYYYTYSYTVWGASSQGIDITVIPDDDDYDPSTLTCDLCDSSDVINDLAIDVSDTYVLWVGTDSGMYYYNYSSSSWATYKTEKTNDFYQGDSYTYAATEAGVYELDSSDTDIDPLYTGDSCAVVDVVNDDDTVSVWHITDSQVCKDGVPVSPQPPEVVCSLDTDFNNTIWCGKYFWDGSSWQVPAGLESEDVVKSFASYEGLIYFLTSSGTLLRW